MKYMLVMSYDGSKYHGFQRQKNLKSVQGEVEQVLSKLLNENIEIKGSGRTDRGVHAKCQVAHLITNKKVKGLKNILNKNLEDIRISKIKKVKDSFHARHSVWKKVYVYKIDTTGNKDSNYYMIEKRALDIKKIKEAAKIFVGKHNFKNFASGERENYETFIFDIKVYRRNKVIYLKFIGTGFFRYMVRNLVGALLEVGKNKIDIMELKDILELRNERRLSTAKANGLYLEKIIYK